MVKTTDSLVVYKKEEFEKIIGNLPFTTEQFNILMAPTPAKYVKTRDMPGGGKADYVSGHYVMNVLNYATGFQWDFEVLEEKEKYGQIVIRGRLSFVTPEGRVISKTQYGRANIKVYSDTIKLRNGSTVKRTDSKAGQPVDYGNDHKAAATDALKKCASLLGVAWDIYGKEDFKQTKITDDPIVETGDGIKHEVPRLPAEEVKYLVELRFGLMSVADKLKVLKDTVHTISDKNLTDEQYRLLYEELSKKRGEEEKGNV